MLPRCRQATSHCSKRRARRAALRRRGPHPELRADATPPNATTACVYDRQRHLHGASHYTSLFWVVLQTPHARSLFSKEGWGTYRMAPYGNCTQWAMGEGGGGGGGSVPHCALPLGQWELAKCRDDACLWH